LSLAKIIKPIASFALPAILMVAFLSLFLNPWAVRTADQFKSQLKSRDELSRLNPGTFKESKSLDRVFYIESFDELGSAVKNIFVQTKHNNKLGVVIASKVITILFYKKAEGMRVFQIQKSSLLQNLTNTAY
jgi:lipopolysaccharide export system permease protein